MSEHPPFLLLIILCREGVSTTRPNVSPFTPDPQIPSSFPCIKLSLICLLERDIPCSPLERLSYSKSVVIGFNLPYLLFLYFPFLFPRLYCNYFASMLPGRNPGFSSSERSFFRDAQRKGDIPDNSLFAFFGCNPPPFFPASDMFVFLGKLFPLRVAQTECCL